MLVFHEPQQDAHIPREIAVLTLKDSVCCPNPQVSTLLSAESPSKGVLYALACSLNRRSRDPMIHPQKGVGEAQMLPNPSRDWGRDSVLLPMESEGQIQV